MEPHLIPWIKSPQGNGTNHEIIENISSPHQATYTMACYQVKKSLWPAKFPDLNTIENV